jgi:tetratricopeptide (TPR) repeat protein
MYQTSRMYGEALRVANKHAPHLVHQINENLSAGPAVANQSPGEILNSAKMWEDSRDYAKAIDRYLEITIEMFNNKEQLEEIYSNCFNLAMNYEKGKVQEVVAVLGTRLLSIEKFDLAGEMYETVGFHDKAIEAYLAAKKWDKATSCARQIRPAEMSEMWLTKINGEKKQMHL